jgi:hypothetical protein
MTYIEIHHGADGVKKLVEKSIHTRGELRPLKYEDASV